MAVGTLYFVEGLSTASGPQRESKNLSKISRGYLLLKK
jgi:hypothetical protein